MNPKPTVLSLIFLAFLFTGTPAGATDTLTVIHEFAAGSGNDPNSLIQASDGNFYGTTYLSASTVFKVTPSGQFTTLYTGTHSNSRYFYGNYFTSVVEGSDGLLYVTELGSNENPNPTLFKISKAGAGYQVVLNSAPDSLSAASDGNLYGEQNGNIFRLTTGGTYTVIFTSGTGGIVPAGFGKQASDGNFYGVCTVANVSGHVCRITTTGLVSSFFQFPTGRSPTSAFVTQGTDGLLYGVVLESNYTTELIFQLSTAGAYRELYQNPTNCTAKTGCSKVIMASDGNLWITNPPGDSVYSITPTGGTLLQTVSFSSQPNAYAHPQILVQGSSGILFGATGEPDPSYNDVGSIFSLNAGLPPPQ